MFPKHSADHTRSGSITSGTAAKLVPGKALTGAWCFSAGSALSQKDPTTGTVASLAAEGSTSEEEEEEEEDSKSAIGLPYILLGRG
jgi:hypothetical protein